ncbi:MAG: ribonuclease H-like domain-containing protein [Armatimonadetes bacterium]|nr:ribonuclease H-like domain-containing protein [Armatimonadota bacterium]
MHLPGVGPRTERRFWASGIEDWDRALSSQPPCGISPRRWDELRDLIEESHRRLERRHYRYFAERLAQGYHWRAWPEFNDAAAYLDIETTGAGPGAQVTLVGVYDGVRVHQFVAGENLEDLPQFLEGFALIVTFNGAAFDLPFLRRRFQKIKLDQLHFDVRFGLQRLGIHGGLKAIEAQLGLVRDADIAGLNGEDAVRLWWEYRAGNDSSLALLLRYNAADVINLEYLADYAYRRLWREGQERAENLRRR